MLAERHVSEAAAIIQHQEQLIREMQNRGENTEPALALLEKLRTTALAMVEHQANIEKQLVSWNLASRQIGSSHSLMALGISI
jgi:hypothetical protein